jgi:branched-chain amino acid transport system substrate-binding protein
MQSSIPHFDNGSGFVIEYSRQKALAPGLGGQLMKTLVCTAAAAGLIALSTGALAQDTMRIGVLVSYSGMGSLSGQQTDATIKLFQQRYGAAPGGRKIEFIRRDTTGPNPEVAKRLVQEVVTRDKVNILIGPDFTPNTLAAAPIVTEAKVPTFVIGAATTGIIGEKSPYFTRTFFAIPQLCKPLAPYSVKNNWKRVYVMVADFAPGHDCERYYTAALAEAGGTLAGNIRIPLSNPEFSAYMQRIKDSKSDALFIFMPIGELSIGSLRAVTDSGLRASGVKITGTGDITDESYVDAVGDAALETITTGIYSTQHDSALNKEFVKDFTTLNGKSPRIGWVNVSIWDAMQLVYGGLAAQSGGSFDPDKFMAYVRGRSLESPRGPVSFDKGNGDITQNVYIRRADKVDGMLQNVEIATLPNEGFK